MDDKYFTPTDDIVCKLYLECMNKYFADMVLPITIIMTEDMKHSAGVYEWEVDSTGMFLKSVIKITCHYQFTKEILEEVMVHEMLHALAISIDHRRYHTHGRLWKKMADDFNLRYGLNITKHLNIYKLPLAPRNPDKTDVGKKHSLKNFLSKLISR